MNWQLISFFGDSTVLLPSAAALFIVLMLRKTSRLLAWQWSLLFGITGAIVCASKLAFMGWGLGIRTTPALAAIPRSLRPSGLSSCGCSAPVSPPVCVKRPLLLAMFWPLWWVIRGWSFMRILFRK